MMANHTVKDDSKHFGRDRLIPAFEQLALLASLTW